MEEELKNVNNNLKSLEAQSDKVGVDDLILRREEVEVIQFTCSCVPVPSRLVSDYKTLTHAI